MGADDPSASVAPDEPTELPGAARVRSGAGHHTAIVTGYETRRIVVASGIQFRSEDTRAVLDAHHLDDRAARDRVGLVSLMEGLEAWVPGFRASSHTTGEYLSRQQGVRFLLRNVATKSEFKAALQTPGLHVVYNGHARWGRGPCFGPIGAPGGDHWEDGDADTGIFRMGYPFIGVAASDIAHHGYHAGIALVADGTPAVEDCEPELAGFHRRLRPTPARELGDEIAALLVDAEGHTLDPETEVWAFRRADEGVANVLFVVLRAGWENTRAAPADLGATEMRCRVFCHFGCDSFQHNQAILRQRKGWQLEGDEGHAYFTSAISKDASMGPWLKHWMTWDQWNAFQPWKPSLDYARSQTNATLARLGHTWRIV